MKRLFSILLASCFVSGIMAQKTIHDPNVVVREVSGSFHSIEVGMGIDLFLSKGEQAVAVSAREISVRDHIKTEVRDGILKISYDWKEGLTRNNKSLKAYVSFKTLDAIRATGGSDVTVDGTIQSDMLSLHISGGSDFSGKISVRKLVLHQSSGSDVDISGVAADAIISASSGSDFDGYDLITETSTINASGGSDINITVMKEITAEASSASDISWKGSAIVKKTKASSAGSVSHRS
jgi:hypothetical protein